MRLRYLPATMRIAFGGYNGNPKKKESNTEDTEVGARRPPRRMVDIGSADFRQMVPPLPFAGEAAEDAVESRFLRRRVRDGESLAAS